MTTINVQFADEKQEVVISWFAGPQDPTVYPNQAQINDSDPRYITFISETKSDGGKLQGNS